MTSPAPVPAPGVERGSARFDARAFSLLVLLVLALHLPFAGRAVQGDDVNYLDVAREAIAHPLTPLNFRYIFQGIQVDMAGHPHPPLNAYLLAALLLVRGHFSEIFFHLAYLVFPLITAAAVYSLAARFTPRPLLAAALFVTAPVVQVVSHSLETDSPALAFGLAGMALLIRGWDTQRRALVAAAAALLSLACLTALQALFVLPVAAWYVLREASAPAAHASGTPRRGLPWWELAACATPAGVLGAWQLLQTVLIGRLPAAVLGAYVMSPRFFTAHLKLANVVVLVQHAAVLAVCLPVLAIVLWRHAPRFAPIAAVAVSAAGATSLTGYRPFERGMFVVFFACGLFCLGAVVRLASSRDTGRDTRFLAGWFTVYFALCLVAFFAGAARYLLLGLPPLVLLVVRLLESYPRRTWIALAAAALAGNVVLGLALADADYQFAAAHRAYARHFAQEFHPRAPFLYNGEWGFRYYMQQLGGRRLWKQSEGQPNELVVSSELALGAPNDSPAEELAVPLATQTVSIGTPLRLIDSLGPHPARSGFLSDAFGVLPFSFSTGALDRIEIARVSPLPALLQQAQADAPGLMLTQFDIAGRSRIVLKQAPGSVVRLPLPDDWSSITGGLFTRAHARFVLDVDAQSLLDRSVDTRSSPGGWAPFVVQLPARSGRVLALRIEAPDHAAAGWGDFLGQ